ncbi:MAG TPA: hypothetical protein VGL23_08860, partial [Chloroflexota bacterium]
PLARSLTDPPPEVREPVRFEKPSAEVKSAEPTGSGAFGPRVLVPVAALAVVAAGGIWFAIQHMGGEVPTPAASPAQSRSLIATATAMPSQGASGLGALTAVPTTPPPTATTAPASPTRQPASPTALPATATPPAATPTSAPASPTTRPVSFRTVLDERFPDNRRGWVSRPGSTAWIADGVYHLVARQPGNFVAVRAPLSARLRDGVVSATFRKVGGPAGGGYGLIVRDQASSAGDGLDQSGRYYVLEVGDKGEVGAWRRDGNRWTDLVSWMRSERVRPGLEPNTLTVRAAGPKITFLVGDSEVLSFEDSTLAEGAVGVFVGGDLNEVQMERFTVQESQ